MLTFEDWWQCVIKVLDNPREIRNWTSFNDYSIGGRFRALSYRSLDRAAQRAWNNGYPFESPGDWIVCTQLKAKGGVAVSKKEFKDRYSSWRAYRDRKIGRKDFDGKTKASRI